MNPEYALSLNNLASLYLDRADFAHAARCSNRRLDIVKQTLGEGHEHYARSLNNLGMVYHELADYAKAEPLFKQAMVLQKAHQGERSADYATTLNNLGLLYFQRADYIQAELYYQRSLEIVKALVGPRHLGTHRASVISRSSTNVRETTRAVQLLREALDIKKVTIGEGHPDYAVSLDNLAATYASMSEYALAEPLYQQALKIRRETLGPNHPDCASTLNNLAGLYGAMADKGAGRAAPSRGPANRQGNLRRETPGLCDATE